MKVKVLASGSTGNSTYVETIDHKILIDAGISKKNIEEGLADLKVLLEEVDTLLITHEHEDHIRSLGAILRKYNLKCYMSNGTFQAILDRKSVV